MWGCVFVCPTDVLCDALTASTSLSARAPCCTPSRVTRRKRALEPSRWQRRGPRRKRRALFRYSFAGGSLPDPIKSMLLPSEDFSPDFGKVFWRPRGCCAGDGPIDRVVPAPAGRTTRPWRTCTLGRAASMAHATTICRPGAERSAARATLGEVRSAPSFVTLPRCGTARAAHLGRKIINYVNYATLLDPRPAVGRGTRGAPRGPVCVRLLPLPSAPHEQPAAAQHEERARDAK